MTDKAKKEASEMETYTLKRTGDRPLRFKGTLLSEASTKALDGPANNRWWDLWLYQTIGGQYVLAVKYCTQWQGEYDENIAVVCDTPDDVINELSMISPESLSIYGTPEQQEKTKRVLSQAWRTAVSDLMHSAGLVEEI